MWCFIPYNILYVFVFIYSIFDNNSNNKYNTINKNVAYEQKEIMEKKVDHFPRGVHPVRKHI